MFGTSPRVSTGGGFQSAYLARMNERERSREQRPPPSNIGTTPSYGSAGIRQTPTLGTITSAQMNYNHDTFQKTYSRESSYLKRLHEKPAPSIAKSASFSSNRYSNQAPYSLAPEPSPSHSLYQEAEYDENHHFNINQHGSHDSYQPMQTKSRVLPSPTETMNSILTSPNKFNPSPLGMRSPNSYQFEDSRIPSPMRNAQTSYDFETRDPSPPKYFPSPNSSPGRASPARMSPIRTTNTLPTNNMSPLRVNQNSPPKNRSPRRKGPSPERMGYNSPPRGRQSVQYNSPQHGIRQSHTDENLGFENLNIHGRSESYSPSPRARQRYNMDTSLSPNRSPRTRKPLSPTHTGNIENTYSYNVQPVRKLPHEDRYSPTHKYGRKFKTTESFHAPYWTQVSVRVSSALLKAGKDKKYAEVAQIAVMQAGGEQVDTDQEALNYVASKASLAVIQAGGDPNTAAIATVACLQANKEEPSTQESFKREVDKVVKNIQDTASSIAKSSYDLGAHSMSVLSGFATKGLDDMKAFTNDSYKRYKIQQRKALRRRQKTLRDLKETKMKYAEDMRRGRLRGIGKVGRKPRRRRYESDEDSDESSSRRPRGAPRGQPRKVKTESSSSGSYSGSSSYSSGSSYSSTSSGSESLRRSSSSNSGPGRKRK